MSSLVSCVSKSDASCQVNCCQILQIPNQKCEGQLVMHVDGGWAGLTRSGLGIQNSSHLGRPIVAASLHIHYKPEEHSPDCLGFMTCTWIAALFTIYIMAMLISARRHVADVAEDIAAIPPTPMESAGVHLGAPSLLVVIAFVEHTIFSVEESKQTLHLYYHVTQLLYKTSQKNLCLEIVAFVGNKRRWIRIKSRRKRLRILARQPKHQVLSTAYLV
ncbi:hypothetical protein VNO77_01588 [Canavalia gladiata]|uniref:Uncharacterized protein n=1 Tax=Canavalia gladiata TaxID=3824 RepID=A0AAN9MS55_CANGL